MTIEAEVQALTVATADLLEAVNIGKENLDAAEAAAELAAAQALDSKNAAATGATTASNAAATATVQAGIATAQANSAVAVVTGGTASITATPGKIPIADGNAKIDPDWSSFEQFGAGSVMRTAQGKMREHVSVLDFGADPTGVADSYPAIMAAINSATYGSGWYVSGPAVYFPPGTYKVNSTIELKRAVKLYGNGSGLSGVSTPTLIFGAGKTGIIVHRYNTIGSGVEGVPTTAGDGSIIEGLYLRGSYGSVDSTGGHGIWLRCRAVVRNCSVVNFSGNGIQVVASAGGPPDVEGNANSFLVDTCQLGSNGEWGLYVQGADANAGIGQAIDCSNNGSGGIWDNSFLGNAYTGCHTSDNGGYASGYNTARNRTSMVTYGGRRYFATYPATTSSLVSTVPGTDSAVWTDASAGGLSPWHPEWVPGQPDGAYFVSNQYRASDINARNVFIGCYEESGYSNSYCGNPSVFIFGATIPVGSGAVLTSDNQNVKIGPALYSPRMSYGSLRLLGADNYEWSHEYVTGRWGYTWANTGGWTYLNFYDRTATTANGYPRNIGDGLGPSGGGGALGISQHFFGSPSQMAFRGLGNSAPTTGTYLQGDRIDNTAPTAGGVLGWVCVASGTPGTWKTFGAISV